MSEQKSKMPDLNEISSMASKLFKDVKTSISQIIDEYKAKHTEPHAGSCDIKNQSCDVKKTTTTTTETTLEPKTAAKATKSKEKVVEEVNIEKNKKL